jgi:putative SOS response-associated peptidase YedK
MFIKVAPTYYQPVIRREGDHEVLDCIRWGIRFNTTNVINTRSDSLEKPFWTSKKRCVVLCQGYYEWSDSPHYISKSDQLLYLAALYSEPKNDYYGYTIVTMDASPEVAKVHSRMPLILKSRNQVDSWVNNEISIENIQLLAGLSVIEVSKAVNKVGNNSSSCIKPVKGKTLITDFFKPTTKF